MKILITLGSISPCDDANTNIAKLIAKELQQMGNEVALFGTSFVNAPVKEDIDGIVYYRKLSVQSKYEQKAEKDLAAGKTLRNCVKHPVYFMKLGYRHFRAKYVDVKKKDYVRELLKLRQEGFECIIAITAPIHSVTASIEVFKDIPVIWYQLNSYSSNITIAYQRIKEKKTQEENILKSVERVILPKLVYQENLKNNFCDYKSKMYPVNFPNVRRLEKKEAIDDIIFDKEFINCVFVGVLYEDIRNPEYLLKMISELPDNNIRVYLIGGGADEIVANYIEACKDNLKVEGRHTLQASINAMLNADVLINIGNSVANMLPSKLNDYISTGKPIVNLCSIHSCPSIEYLAKYQNVLNLFNSNKVDESVDKFISFVQKEKEDIPFEQIESVYYESTPRFVVEQMFLEK